MDKIKEIGIKPLALAMAVLALLAGVLGVASIGVLYVASWQRSLLFWYYWYSEMATWDQQESLISIRSFS